VVGHSCPTPLIFVISQNWEPSRLFLISVPHFPVPISAPHLLNSVIPTAADRRNAVVCEVEEPAVTEPLCRVEGEPAVNPWKERR
jgi:hypothetical protein